MPETVETIGLKLPFGMGTVNCYLLGSGSDRVLIDTGPARARGTLEWALQDADCDPGDLSLIVVTHGDPDHTGSCAYLKREFKTKVALHPSEATVVEHGEFAASRENMSSLSRGVAKVLGPLVRLKRADRFKPDILLKDAAGLSQHGINAKVYETPGHSSGSVSILTSDGDLFCGDLMENGKKGPRPGSIVDDPELQAASISKVLQLGAKVVYPGHGESFTVEEYLAARGEG